MAREAQCPSVGGAVKGLQSEVRDSNSFQSWHLLCGSSRWTFPISDLVLSTLRETVSIMLADQASQTPSVAGVVKGLRRKAGTARAFGPANYCVKVLDGEFTFCCRVWRG